MEQPVITLELDLSQAAVMATALQGFVGTLNGLLPQFIALEGEGTGRTVQALDLKFEALTTMRTLFVAAHMPPEQITAVIRSLSEGE